MGTRCSTWPGEKFSKVGAILSPTHISTGLSSPSNGLTVPTEELKHLVNATQFIAGAVKRSVGADGFNVITNNGNSAGQTVYHFHFHIIPRFNDDFNFKPRFKNYATGGMKEYADSIRSVVEKYKDVLDG